MKKSIIDAKQALDDIRAGMDDFALMQKYNLSSRGLQSLYEKLGKRGIIRHINAREVVKDLKAGMSHGDLMQKYELNDKGLEALFAEMQRAGLWRVGAEQDPPFEKVVIHVGQIVDHIRSGMSRSHLMGQYQLTPRALRWICMMLLCSGAVSWKEIYGKISSNSDESVPDDSRKSRRYILDFEVPVYDLNNPRAQGVVRDVSETGISIRGIKARRGQARRLMMCGEGFGENARFAVDVICRWASRTPSGTSMAGFEITNTSVGNLGEFHLLIQLVSPKG